MNIMTLKNIYYKTYIWFVKIQQTISHFGVLTSRWNRYVLLELCFQKFWTVLPGDQV